MSDEDTLSALLSSPPSSVASLLSAVNPEIYANLKNSVELQRWPDGTRLSATQLENAMQLIILYEHQYLPAGQRTGQPLSDSCGSAKDEVQSLAIRDSSGAEDR